jgi:hypothetical protein
MEIKHEQLRKLIKKSDSTKRPLYIAGTTGIGKSFIVKDMAKIFAKQKERDFIEWNKISDKEKLVLCEDKGKRERSYIFADVRLSQLDPSDLRGLPKLNGKDYVEWKPNLLFRVLSSSGVEGTLFFDEMNLAPPSVQATAYQIILDKCVGELAINPDITIIGAGNRLEDKANVFEMGAPLRNRFCHVTLAVPMEKDWIDWAMDNEVDDRIISFIQFRPELLMADISKTKDLSAFPTPRSWKFCSELIQNEDKLEDVHIYSSTAVGDGVSIEFKSFLKLREQVDIKSILDNPKQIEGLGVDMKWAIISAVSEKYKSNKKLLEKAVNVCNYMEIDFGASLLRMLKRQDIKHFSTNLPKCKNWTEIANKFGKYVRKSI